jgi:hypothetical protein
MLTVLKPTEMVLDRLSDREFAREWLKAHDEEIDAKDKRIAELEAALSRLVEAKDEKDASGETARYHELKAGAWDRARELLGR